MTREQEEDLEKSSKEIVELWKLGGKYIKDIIHILDIIIENALEQAKKDRQLEEKNNRIRNLEKEAQGYFDGMAELNSKLVKKDKIIDLMAEKLKNNIYIFRKKTKKDIIKEYERKAENSSGINTTPEKN